MSQILLIAADAVSGLLFVGSGVLLWKVVRQKIPDVRRIPDEFILERYREDAKKHALWTLPLKLLYDDVEYQDFFRRYRARWWYRIHISLLRMDNRVLAKYNRLRKGDEERDESADVAQQ